MSATLPPWPSGLTLRRWQGEAVKRYYARGEGDFLCVSTPGAGKTRFALYVAHQELLTGSVERLVVVVPTEHLKAQWQAAAAAVGIQLQREVSNVHGTEAPDQHGAVLTYAQVALAPLVHRQQCRRATLVVFDEPHHTGRHLSWGRGVQAAFEHAAARLSITGTPFRSDSNPIPFVRYDDGRCSADYSYGYSDALTDRVCRAIYFPSYEGRMTWWTGRAGEVSASFAESLPEQERARRLRTALAATGQWLPAVLRDADARLSEVRRTQYPTAAGLVIAMDQQHARAIRQLLAGVTGEDVALAVSDDPDASSVIERFAHGTGRWLVAVRMVSEGVDIPRLFLGVYATNVLTELYFRQAVGRFVRMIDGLEDQPAYLFMPREGTLIEYVQRIKEERDHVLDGEDEEADGGAPAPGEPAQQADLFTPLSASAQASDVFTHDSVQLTPAELAEARALIGRAGLEGLSDVIAARLLRESRRDADIPVAPPMDPSPPAPALPLELRKKLLRGDIQRTANLFQTLTQLPYATVGNLLNHTAGITDRNRTTLDVLEDMLRLARELVRRAKAEDAPELVPSWLEIARVIWRQLRAVRPPAGE